MKLLRVDWAELEEAFQDGAQEHRYYLDRETGQVHFFSAYLDNDDEREDERRLSAEDRYVSIPLPRRLVPFQEIHRFVGSLSDRAARRVLASSLEGPECYQRFADALDRLPSALVEWSRFRSDRVRQEVTEWLSEVGVQPLE